MILRFYRAATGFCRVTTRHTSTISVSKAVSQAADRRRALFISPVWPERSSSAAGVRTADLIQALQEAGWTVSYVSASKPNLHSQMLNERGCKTFHCLPNREAAFETVVAAVEPHLCIFDRFIAEEAYSFRVKQLAPKALRVLDLQDLHCLRRGRQQVQREGALPCEVLRHRPGPDSNDALRELSAIHRSDLALVCSPVELDLLQNYYQIAGSKLILAPFFVECPDSPRDMPAYFAREHFVTIGNFKHDPNLDSVRWLVDEMWKQIQKTLSASQGSKAELHIYGAYGNSGEVHQLHRPADGIFLKGHAPSLDILSSYRVLLAPLRFGAGLKGKIVDAWAHGLPVCTTPIGAEGMCAPDHTGAQWGGLWQAESATAFAEDAAKLYTLEMLWTSCQAEGFELLEALYNRKRNLATVLGGIDNALNKLEELRGADFVGSMLWMQQFRATEYFSRWIELKEAGSG